MHRTIGHFQELWKKDLVIIQHLKTCLTVWAMYDCNVNLAAKAAFKAVGYIVKEEFNLSHPVPFAGAEALQVCKLTNLIMYLS